MDVWHGTESANFVSNALLRPPRLSINVYAEHALSPGYWFFAPYYSLDGEPPATIAHPIVPGPYIFDQRGELVWSGASEGEQELAFSFKPTADGEHLSYLSRPTREKCKKSRGYCGKGIILNDSYQPRNAVEALANISAWDMHEWNVLPNQRSVLALVSRTVPGVLSEKYQFNGSLHDPGFIELDIKSDEILFQWFASDKIGIDESVLGPPLRFGEWDYLHMNSVDKDVYGNYIVSARYANCIYNISHLTGDITWRLGGVYSSFSTSNNLRFFGQHDARIISQNSTHANLTLLDNGSNQQIRAANVSRALLIQLDLEQMTASLLQEWPRPDGHLSELRGNVQLLPNGNVFTCWSDEGYITEHSADGKLLMHARFVSKELKTYRAYKYEFSAKSLDPIAVRAFIHDVDNQNLTTVFVSWNGATDIEQWILFGEVEGASPLATVTKQGFESIISVPGAHTQVKVIALSADGKTLGTSSLHPSEFRGQRLTSDTTVHATVKPDLNGELEDWFETGRSCRFPSWMGVALLMNAIQCVVIFGFMSRCIGSISSGYKP